jgi:protein PhnA
MNAALNTRADGRCELCGADSELSAHAVAPHTEASDAHGVVICGTCAPQLVEGSTLDAKHWFCLQEAIWSEVGAVQVLSWRLLNRLQDEGWARDLLEQAYLADDVLEWAKQGLPSDEDDGVAPTVDSNGTVLSTGDSVSLIRSLDVKGTSFIAKRGTTVRGIRVTDDPTHVEGRVNGVSIYLKTCFLKKIG